MVYSVLWTKEDGRLFQRDCSFGELTVLLPRLRARAEVRDELGRVVGEVSDVERRFEPHPEKWRWRVSVGVAAL